MYIEVDNHVTGQVFTSYKTGNITGRYKINATQNYTMTRRFTFNGIKTIHYNTFKIKNV